MAGSAPELTALASRLRKALLKIDGVVESPGIFGEGDAFWVNGKQMANFTGVDSVEIRMTRQEIRARRDALQVDPRVTLRSSSDWIGVRFTMAKDLRVVIDLAEVAASVYRAPSGATARLSEVGADAPLSLRGAVARQELIQLLRNEHGALDTTLSGLTREELCAPTLDGGWSIKDVIAHVTTWERRIMRAVTGADRGEEIAWPEPGFQMHETDRLNERDFLANRARPLNDVTTAWRATLEDYVSWINSFSEDELPRDRPYTPGLTLERMIRGNGDEHIREHRRVIEAYIAGRSE